MKQRPILMSGPLVRAILEGKKTQTRRPVKALNEDPDNFELTTTELITMLDDFTFPHFEFEVIHNGNILCVASQYGVPGDELWLKEGYYAWGWWNHNTTENGDTKSSFVDQTLISGREYIYQTEDPPVKVLKGFSAGTGWYKRNSLYMPKTASRVTLEILDIGVERLWDISEEDAKAEGVEPTEETRGESYAYRAAFIEKWIEIYGNESHMSNPWVWVIKFQKTGLNRI